MCVFHLHHHISALLSMFHTFGSIYGNDSHTTVLCSRKFTATTAQSYVYKYREFLYLYVTVILRVPDSHLLQSCTSLLAGDFIIAALSTHGLDQKSPSSTLSQRRMIALRLVKTWPVDVKHPEASNGSWCIGGILKALNRFVPQRYVRRRELQPVPPLTTQNIYHTITLSEKTIILYKR